MSSINIVTAVISRMRKSEALFPKMVFSVFVFSLIAAALSVLNLAHRGSKLEWKLSGLPTPAFPIYRPPAVVVVLVVPVVVPADPADPSNLCNDFLNFSTSAVSGNGISPDSCQTCTRLFSR
ncbi:MAG: hypothetical protein AABZ63_05960, partial [Actinomycetota bacterium]